MMTHSVDSVGCAESNKSLKHELCSIQRSSLLHVSLWCCGILSVS